MSLRTRRWLVIGLCCLTTASFNRQLRAEALPAPGDPRTLTDWRWLARKPIGQRRVATDPSGKNTLPKTDGGFLILEVDGPGVLDYFWTDYGNKATLTIEVDGRMLWKGRFGDAVSEARRSKTRVGPFPAPIVDIGGRMVHLLAPVGFERSLRLVSDKATFPHYACYRTLPKGASVSTANAEPGSSYGRKLQQAADAWGTAAYDFKAATAESARRVRQDFTLPAGGRTTAMRLAGSGEVVGLELHIVPARTGSLRNVVVECYYDGATKPELRLPITDLVGLPHPWTNARWDSYLGDRVAGIRLPWTLDRPRVYHHHVAFHINLPIPFSEGLRIDLVNRSKDHFFSGFARANVVALSDKNAGRLCGTRRLVSVSAQAQPRPLLRLPGPGQAVGLGIFLTGCALNAPAAQNGIVSLTIDDNRPITGAGLIPLWATGAPTSTGIWNHIRYQDGFVGAMRHFVTDPLPLERSATLAYTPGRDARGAPDKAVAVALWYRFGGTPYEAPALAERAEPLPHSTYPMGTVWIGQGKNRKAMRMVWAVEAEDFASKALAHGCTVEAVEDVEHNYQPSGGKYLLVVADQRGSHADVTVDMPASRYVAVGTNSLWGPGRGTFHVDLVSLGEVKRTRRSPIESMLADPPRNRSILMPASMEYRRDPTPTHREPMLNPNPNGKAVLRFVCMSGTMQDTNIMTLDNVRLDMPPPTEPRWHEFEEGATAEAETGLTVWVPKYGAFAWSGWGALRLRAWQLGTATVNIALPKKPSRPRALVIRGTLGPKQGAWELRVGKAKPVTLTPGKDDETVVEWTIPLAGAKPSQSLTLDLKCIVIPKRERGMRVRPDAQLVLDAWTVR